MNKIKTCTICNGKHWAKGLCSKHYEIQRSKTRYKSSRPTWSMPLEQRLIEHSIPITETGCFIWLLSLNKHGYGKTSLNHKTITAHRASYEIHFGKIPDGMFVCHKCDTPSCINPAHLFLGTHQDNIDDRQKKNRGIKGSKVGISKLKESDIPLILSDNRTQAEIAKTYSVSQVLISTVKLGKTWKHV